MPENFLEQALYHRPPGGAPRLGARSPGFLDGWLPAVELLLLGFGDRPAGIPCPAAVFAQPLDKEHVAVVQVADQPVNDGPLQLGFRVLVLPRALYRQCEDPFTLADCFPPPWQHSGLEMPSLTLLAQALKRRTLADVQQVLQRVKAGALRENEDPETAELTMENAESPALLGGVQILVDGGKLVFTRPAPDPGLIRGLWMLLPGPTRSELWPATFAFSNVLGFDALVLPWPAPEHSTGYTTEQQAADYPAGRYELSLQTAAESGDQAALDALFCRRGSHEMLRLGIGMVLVLSMAVLMLRVLTPELPPREVVALVPAQREAAARAAAMVANRDPWTAVALHQAGRYRSAERAATAAAIVASQDPIAAAIQVRSAQARYSDIWKPAD